jgi:host factor-I protein
MANCRAGSARICGTNSRAEKTKEIKAGNDRRAGVCGIKNGTTAMAADRAQNLQDTFLNHVRKNKIPLTIFLVNGVKLQGVVTWFDNFCVLLRRDGHSQLVYKHAISTIMPGHPVQLFEGAEEAPTGE